MNQFEISLDVWDLSYHMRTSLSPIARLRLPQNFAELAKDVKIRVDTFDCTDRVHYEIGQSVVALVPEALSQHRLMNSVCSIEHNCDESDMDGFESSWPYLLEPLVALRARSGGSISLKSIMYDKSENPVPVMKRIEVHEVFLKRLSAVLSGHQLPSTKDYGDEGRRPWEPVFDWEQVSFDA